MNPPSLLNNGGPTLDFADLLGAMGDSGNEIGQGQDDTCLTVRGGGEVRLVDGDRVQANFKVIDVVDRNNSPPSAHPRSPLGRCSMFPWMASRLGQG